MGVIVNTTQMLCVNIREMIQNPWLGSLSNDFWQICKLLESNNMYQATVISIRVQSLLCECSQNNKDYRFGGVLKTDIFEYYF